MNTLKSIAVLVLCQFALLSATFAETFFGTEVAYTDQALEAGFEAYKVFSLDYLEIYDYVQSQGDTDFDLTIKLDDTYTWNLNLMEHDMRGELYREVEMTPQGNIDHPLRDCITYAGYRDNQDITRFTISDYQLIGMIRVGEKSFFIEPLSRIAYGAPDNYFVVYSTADVIIDSDVSCGASDVLNHQIDNNQKVGTGESATLNCLEVDFALAADFLEFQNLGSFNATVDHMLSITSFMEALYDDFDLDYIVQAIFVATSAAADPWTSSLSTDDLLPDFRSWGPGGFGVPFDVAQLWTDRNITGCGTGSGLIGCAYIGTVCNTSRFSVCEDWSSSMSCLSSLAAHELGHNWSATHTDQIMNAGIICSATTWNPSNITQINNHISSRTCLASCATTCPPSYSLVDWINAGTWKYEAASSISSTGNISGSADVIYDAGSIITLQEGFSATPTTSGSFNAVLDGCGGSLTTPDEEVTRQAPTPISIDNEIMVAPNPFSGITNISLSVEGSSLVDVHVMDVTGKIVGELYNQENLEAGDYSMQWDSRDFPQGTYILRVVIDGEITTEILSVMR